MQISENLPQFNEGAGLLIVSGDFEVDFYLASKGEIDKVDSFQVERRNPEIPVGFVAAESGNMKTIKKYRHSEFLEEFKKHLAPILKENKIAAAHLFAPTEVKNELEKALPAGLRKNLKVHDGNFHKEHPFKLLEKLHELPSR